ncbi:MAG TPA: DUF4190 domain-containing protein [Candidatus Paceibacterota bacterium]|jgi:hypothetical protein|nr:DUF4190 domain-containing protein [Verrucomicrobiota bacterium]HRD04829.1 DUF4190 domain-containing protein [Verrucomicrobiota bacterium]HRY57534.1 DUF4190 domain-containing protein [Candidatus Paceibacterota bacterium]HRZ68362.1 DUF4190 domain-containing protein [Candidatus Paceibacterota bacterium]
MYRIIGSDGRTYGPATADQLREWIAEGRADAQTQVWTEGASQWRPLAEYAEFAPLLAMRPPSLAAPGTACSAARPPSPSLATASLVMGLLSLTCGLCCCYGLPFNLLGIVFALVALAQMRHQPWPRAGRGQAIAGLVLSLLSLALGAFLGVLSCAINAPEILRHLDCW